jgi:hypothetical protein
MATVDDILGPAPKAGLPTVDSVLGPQSRTESAPASTGEEVADFIAKSPVGRVLDAFGQGLEQGWGSEPLGIKPETEEYLRKIGVFNDYQKGQTGIVRALNEGVFRPTAIALDAAMRVGSAGFAAAQGAVAQVAPRDIAALPEAFFGTPHPMGLPDVALARARDLRIIGEGEDGWKGTADQRAAFEEARQRFAPSQDAVADAKEAAQESGAAPASEPQPAAPQAAEPPPDIHSVARQLAPETFQEYDALAQRKQTFGRWIDELAQTRDQAATADIDRQIAEQQARLEDATGKKAATYRDRIDGLNEQRDQALEDARAKDSPDMARIRQELQQTDYRMRDLAPDVTRAYRAAQEQMPEPPALETAPMSEIPAPVAGSPPARAETPQAAEAAPAPAPAAAKAAPVDIAADVAQKLTAAGRPADESQAAAAIVAAHYEARASRLGTTAGELYGKDGASIEAAPRGRKGELGRTVLKDGRATIRLMGNADASTFVHETGHQWLEELTRDATDERATPDVKKDAQTVRDWLGNDGGEITRSQHEKFARGFERYLMEGRAPTQQLAGVFAKFKGWLTTIYQTVAKLRAPISDDIRDVFDRLIAKEPEGRGTVVAPERQAELGLGERHEALAEQTPPEQSDTVADRVRAETDTAVKAGAPEVADEIGRGAEGEIGGNAPAGAEPHGDRTAPEPVPGETRGGSGGGAVGQGRGEAAPQGAGARAAARVSRAPLERVPREPQRLLSFLRTAGGVKDESGEISTALGGVNKRPGLINNKGLSLDEAALRAWEHGFIGTKGGERPTINDLLDAIDQDARGHQRYSAEDEEAVARFREALSRNAEIDRLAKHYGIDHRTMTRDQFFTALAERASREDQAKEIASQTDAHEAALREAEEKAEQGRGDAFEPPPDGGNVPGRTLEDLDNERRAEQTASGTGSSAGVAVASRPGRAGAGEAGAGQRGRGAGPAGPHDTLPDTEPGLVDKAGNIRLDNLNTPDDVNQVLRETAEQNGDFLAARRGVVSDGQILDLADAMGVDAQEVNIKKLRQMSVEDGVPLAARILAGRKMLIQSATAVSEAMAKAATGTDADVLAYAAAKDRHVMIMSTVSGITAEWGRAGRAFREIEGGEKTGAIGDFVKQATGKTLFQLRNEAKLGSALQTPSQVAKYVQETTQTRWQKVRAGILSYFINNLISGPLTHAGYSIGNTVWAIFKATADTTASATIGAAREAIAGKPVDRVYFGEVGAQLYGMVRGSRDGYTPAIAALKTGVSFMKGDVEGQGSLALGESALRPQAIPGKVGYVLETPSRSVAAIHTMFYSMNYEAEIARRAYRTATKEGLQGQEFSNRVADLTQNPSPETVAAAHEEALQMVLMKKPAFDSAQYHLSRAVNSNILAKMVMPFMQIGANILREGYIEHSPLGLASRSVRDNLMGRNGAVARDTQAAKISVGTALGAAVLGLTAEGILTGGGPSDPKELAMKEMTGWKPYSIRIGDFYIPHRKYLGPLGPLIAGVSDMYETGHALNEGGLTKAAAGAAFGFAQVIADESWARGLSNFIDAARHWDRDGGKYLRNLATDFIPFSVGIGQIAHTIDPYRREVRGLMDAVRAKMPGLSQGLYPVRDVWGNPISGGTMLSPSAVNNDPVNKALLKLDIFPARLERKIRGVELSDQQYDDFTRIAGRMAKMRLDNVVGQPGFSSLSDTAQRDMIESTVKSSREAARGLIMMAPNSNILADAMKAKVAKLTGAK